jgi:hypothetical protein
MISVETKGKQKCENVLHCFSLRYPRAHLCPKRLREKERSS